MFGTFRFILAILVVLSHLTGAGLMHYAGLYAVRAFFVVSGFAVSIALNNVYRFDFRRFAINRLLRLMPSYLLVCGMTALAIALLPRQAALFMPRWAFEPSAGAILQNLVLVPLVFQAPDFRFIEPAWSVAVEIFMYALLFLGMARSARGALIGLGAGVAFHVVTACVGATFTLRYFSVPSAILSFSLGSTLFFHGHWLLERFGRLPVGRAAALMWGGNILIAGSVAAGYGDGFGYYCGTALATVLVAVLANRDASPNGHAIDRALGHLSYPIFLLQWLGGGHGPYDLSAGRLAKLVPGGRRDAHHSRRRDGRRGPAVRACRTAPRQVSQARPAPRATRGARNGGGVQRATHDLGARPLESLKLSAESARRACPARTGHGAEGPQGGRFVKGASGRLTDVRRAGTRYGKSAANAAPAGAPAGGAAGADGVRTLTQGGRRR